MNQTEKKELELKMKLIKSMTATRIDDGLEVVIKFHDKNQKKIKMHIKSSSDDANSFVSDMFGELFNARKDNTKIFLIPYIDYKSETNEYWVEL